MSLSINNQTFPTQIFPIPSFFKPDATHLALTEMLRYINRWHYFIAEKLFTFRYKSTRESVCTVVSKNKT